MSRQGDAMLEEIVCGEGTTLAEIMLWTPWKHTGDLVAACDSMTLRLSFADFAHLAKTYAAIHEALMKHAERFVNALATRPKSVSDLTTTATLLGTSGQKSG